MACVRGGLDGGERGAGGGERGAAGVDGEVVEGVDGDRACEKTVGGNGSGDCDFSMRPLEGVLV